ncbi:hypothetical protein HUK49_04935 [Limosilactobacillus sp. c11Ua_112_M]|uniref:hypothetical protein n=1 Tax=Limosilactobacillus TaxID=2742598 RepID=UPI001782627C|nr:MULTISPECIES: hypothetical protein [Limosilactobacillus]MBD8087301.1 hypothetical protein [Limosilactobacillus portuensis]MEC4741781.1 hypothetical protein [Limosilactobacillus sp. c10Ua_36]
MASKVKKVSTHIELDEPDNIELVQQAKAENISKKELIQNIIHSYLHEQRVSELLPNMIDQNRRLAEFLNDVKELLVTNSLSLNQIKSLLYEQTGLDNDFTKEAKIILNAKENNDDSKFDD